MELLIAEDDVINRALLAKALREYGHHLVVTENGVQAWECLQKNPIGLVITDWVMPKMDGLDLCRKIRAAAFDRYVYVIMLTAKDDKKDLLKVFESGADDYVKKPFDPDELNARVLTGIRILQREESHRRRQQDILNVATHIKLKNERLEAAMANSGVEIPGNEPVTIPLDKVKVGMVLAEDLRLRDGLLLLTKGTHIKEVSLRSIRNFVQRGMLSQEVAVLQK